MGGSVIEASTVDVLVSQMDLTKMDPNVILRPDSIGTLSFTSVSTGVPKDPKGQHYSLMHFFLHMGQHLEIEEYSRLTLLSSIACNPIQRLPSLNEGFFEEF